MLLRGNDHAGTTDAHPSNERLCIKTILVHNVKPDEGSCAAKTCPAVHSNSLSSPYIVFSKRDKLANDVILWAGAVRELHFVHFYLVSFVNTRII